MDRDLGDALFLVDVDIASNVPLGHLAPEGKRVYGLARISSVGSHDFRAVDLSLDVPILWDVRPEHLGRISPNGDFTAADLHIESDSWQRPRGYVVAEVRVGSGQVFRGAAAVVFDLPGSQVFVHISPRSVALSEGESFQFQAEDVTDDGTPVTMDFQWRAVDPVLGTVDAGGLFTATTNVPDARPTPGVTSGERPPPSALPPPPSDGRSRRRTDGPSLPI